MKFTKLYLEGAFVIEPEVKSDERGFFARIYCEDEFIQHGLNINWQQANNSYNVRSGTLRGLHFQAEPMAEVKLVRCIKGAIWDVIVDLRKDSSTYGKWFGVELNEFNRRMVYVPKGFAHGFISLSEISEILYLVSNKYSPSHERSLSWCDPTINIKWPISPSIISDRDKNAQKLQELS